jgi:hypothetical protein
VALIDLAVALLNFIVQIVAFARRTPLRQPPRSAARHHVTRQTPAHARPPAPRSSSTSKNGAVQQD